MLRSCLSQTVICLSLLSVAGIVDASDSDTDEMKKTRIARIEQLEKTLAQTEEMVRRKRNELSKIVDSMGTGDSSVMNFAQQTAIEQLAQLRLELSKIRRERIKAEMELNAHKQAVSKSEPNLPTGQTSESDSKPNPGEAASKAETKIDAESRRKKDSQLGKDLENDSIASRLVKELELFRTQLEQSQRQLAELTKRIDRLVAETTESLPLKIEILTKQESQIVEEMKELEQKIKNYGRASFDVETKRKELESLDPVVANISQEIERVKIHLNTLTEVKAKPH